MPRPYTEIEKEKIKEDLMTCVLKLIYEKGYVHTSITNIAQAAGTSKAYFYTMFPSKEVLIAEALKRQQRTMVQKAREIAEEQGLLPREKLTAFLEWLVTAINHTFFFMLPGEAEEVGGKLSKEERERFFNNLLKQQKDLLSAMSIHMEETDMRVFGNLIINLFMVCGSGGSSCYYKDSVDDMINQLIRGIVVYVESKQ